MELDEMGWRMDIRSTKVSTTHSITASPAGGSRLHGSHLRNHGSWKHSNQVGIETSKYKPRHQALNYWCRHHSCHLQTMVTEGMAVPQATEGGTRSSITLIKVNIRKNLQSEVAAGWWSGEQ